MDEFRASSYWIHSFKKRHNIVSRKVTKYTSRAEEARAQQIEESFRNFLDSYQAIRHLFPYHLVVNMDQSPFSYEVSNERTLTIKGVRDVAIHVDSKNKNSHSYTSQPIVTRDGRLAGKLLICLQENKKDFGPRVGHDVDELVSALGNVYVVCSTSGLMSNELIKQWAEEVLLPAARERMLPHDGETDVSDTSMCTDDSSCTEPIAGPSWAANPANLTEGQRQILNMRNSARGYVQRPDLLLVADSWSGHSKRATEMHFNDSIIGLLRIPPHGTSRLQPLDVTFFRQYKIFWKRITKAALHNNKTAEITTAWVS